MTRLIRRPKLLPALLSLLLASGAALAQSDGKAARFYEDALRRYEKRDMAGAIIQLKNALQIDKTLLPVHVLLGKTLLANSEPHSAEIEFAEALRLGVDRAEVVVPLAKALMAQGKQALVFEDARLKPEGLPNSVRYQLLLARAAAASDIGDSRGTLRAIEEARQIDPADVASWLAEVPLRIRAHQFAEASAAADKALKLSPDSSEGYYQKGAIAHAQGQIQVALGLYDRALKIDSGHVEARLSRAGIQLDLGRDKDVQADIAELARLAPSDPRGTYLRALLAERAGDPAGARAALKQVTELLDPVPIEFIRYRPQMLMLNGLAHFSLNELEKAKPYLEYALRLQPNTPLAKLLAQVSLAEPNVSRAIDLLEGYLRTQPGDAQALLMLATAHMNQGRHAKATALMQEALRTKDSPEFRTVLGLSLMRGGKGSTATAELERAFKADPRQLYAGLALVTLYLRDNQLAKAQGIADGLVKANPNNPSVLLVQGQAHLRNGDPVGARASYEKALQADPKLIEAKLGLARVEVTTKSFDAASKRLRELQKTEERNVDVLFEMALMYELWGKDDEALRWLESAVAASPQREARANFAIVTWHQRKGQPAKALEAAKLLLAKLPEDPEALQAYAAAQLATGDLPGARSTLTNASRRAGFEAPLQTTIARAQLQAQDVNGAAYSLDKALTGAPDYFPAQVLLASVELMQGDAAKSERRARQIIQSRPKEAIGHSLLADVALSRQQPAQAIESLRRAHEIERSTRTFLPLFQVLLTQNNGRAALDFAQGWIRSNPKDLAAQKALAEAQVRSGDFAAARRTYETVLKQRPDDVGTLNNLANVLIAQKDKGAAAVAEKALALSPRSAIVIDTAGWAQHLAGNRDRALQLLRDARLRDPANPDIRYHLAAVLAQAGRSGEAREELQAALKTTSFESAKDARTLLDTLK